MRPSSSVPLAVRDVELTLDACSFRPRALKGNQLMPTLPAPKVFPAAGAPWMLRLVTLWRARQLLAYTAAHASGAPPGAPVPSADAAGSFWLLPADSALSNDKASSDWLDIALTHLSVRAPMGGKYTPKCTRKGGATAFAAIGGSCGAICFLGDWASSSPVPERHYIDRSVAPCPAARFFFGFRLTG
jgi:hypothetical protein